MYKFLYNFSVYVNCYPQYHNNELFYLSHYLNIKNSLFNDIDLSIIKLNNFMYFGAGTILHAANFYVNYATVLVDDGFDYNKKNIENETPIGIAKSHNNLPTLAYYQVLYILFCFV